MPTRRPRSRERGFSRMKNRGAFCLRQSTGLSLRQRQSVGLPGKIGNANIRTSCFGRRFFSCPKNATGILRAARTIHYLSKGAVSLKYPFVKSYKGKEITVIPSQCAHWRGNPFSLKMPEIRTFQGNADCHTSDRSHWCGNPFSFEEASSSECQRGCGLPRRASPSSQ